MHPFAFEARQLVGRTVIFQFFHKTQEQEFAPFFKNDGATTKLNVCFHLVAFRKEGFGVAKFNRVLIRGGRANDLPGVSYSLVRGVYDFPALYGKKKSRSFYGVARPERPGVRRHVRRKLRKKL